MQKNRILVIAADKLTQQSLADVLCRNGYGVDTLSSVQEALSCLNGNTYQVILIDILEKGCMDLLRIAKERGHPAEILVLTSYDHLDTASASLSLGAFDCIVRPLEDKKILSVIKRALGHNGAAENNSSVITRPAFYPSGPVAAQQTCQYIDSNTKSPLTPLLQRGEMDRNEKSSNAKSPLVPLFHRRKTDKDVLPAALTERARLADEVWTAGMIGASAKMKAILTLIKRIANSRSTVLLRGESGSGKRVIARAIHKADKARRNKPFIEIACGALSKGLVESELFGHIRGAFTDAVKDRKGRFELADGGTILLDDIDALSLDLQVKLLRVLQHKEFERVGDHQTIKVDVRIIAATNHNLEEAVAEGEFRQDVYYRLNVIAIDIPPLRERKEDIPLLVRHFIDRYAAENSREIKTVAEEIFPVLMRYDWPGNIRELENLMERAVIMDTDGVIACNDLPEIFLNSPAAVYFQLDRPAIAGVMSLKNAIEEPEKIFILKVLKETRGNKKKAARKLGVNRTTLYNKLRKYHLLTPSLS